LGFWKIKGIMSWESQQPLAKENAELKARIIKLEVAEPENQDGNAI
jgi:hypothetical protein